MMRLEVLIGIALFAATPVVAEEAWKGKDLQVLPKNISKDRLKLIMKAQAESLGVDCDFCHKVPEMHLDTEHKTVARRMIRMVKAVNKQYFDGKNEVQCITCHRGEKEPLKPK